MQPIHRVSPQPAEDVAFCVEVWDAAGEAVERLVASTATASLGFVAYYAAAREFPDRVITLRCGESFLATWSQSPPPGG